MLTHIVNVSGYQLNQIVYQTSEFVLVRCQKLRDLRLALIKILMGDRPTLEQVTRLKQEYVLCKDLEIEGILKPIALETYDRGLILILEDFRGIPLSKLLKSSAIGIADFLTIAIQVVNAIGQLHQHQVIHKNITTDNILIDRTTNQVKITDFSIASKLFQETPILSINSWLPENLAYISPEQSGRMNRCVDYRSDFYSLGVTFYELLTGKLPFVSDDRLELIHYHIAFQPLDPHQIDPNIPLSLSNLVMKLLAKNAEDRYQTTAGLLADLERCWQQWQADRTIPEFEPGLLDLSGQLSIPQKLYGREKEVAVLLAAFDRVASLKENKIAPVPAFSPNLAGMREGWGRAEIMLVSGYSGTGKSSLVNEVHKLTAGKHGYFISGKFDQFKRNNPYSGLIQAFGALIGQLLAESREKLSIWREEILQALGSQGKLIIDLIPELEIIISNQPEVVQLPISEAQKRLSLLFKDFIGVFSKKEHPLVLFLDDLQWADLASLNLIELLVDESSDRYLLLIGAYRNNEVDSSHPFRQIIDKIQQQGITVNEVVLEPLNLSNVINLLTDTLKNGKKVTELAYLLCNKTGGNPFFLNQLLQSLYQERLLRFDYESATWQWSIEEIQAIGITDKNVVDLVASKIQKMPEATQQVLKLAACIGNRFTLDVLSIVNKQTNETTASQLWLALQLGLILPLNEAYKIPMVWELGMINGNSEMANYQHTVSYKFLHDRIQQAAYSLIPEAQKKNTHRSIGELLLQSTPKENLEENIFNIVNQLNIAVDLLLQKSEKYELARLNLIAARKATAAAANETAVRYLRVGMELLAADSWQSDYELTLAIYELAAEAEYLNGNYEASKKLVDITLKQARNGLDKVKVYEIQIQSYNSQGKGEEGIKTGLQALKTLGVSLPEEPSKLYLWKETIAVKLVTGMKKIEDLVNLPQMTSPDKRATLKILLTIYPPCYFTKPQLLPPIAFTMVKLCLQYGNSPQAALAYTIYGVWLCIVGDINTGYQYGQLALKLLDKYQNKQLKAKVYKIFFNLIYHWKGSVREVLSPLEEAFQISMESGDLEYIGYTSAIYCENAFVGGQLLEVFEQKSSHYLSVTKKNKLDGSFQIVSIFRQAALNMRGQALDRCRLIGDSFNEIEAIPALIKVKFFIAVAQIYYCDFWLCYYFKKYSQALKNYQEFARYKDALKGGEFVPSSNFYYSLILLGLYPSVSQKEQKKYLRQVEANQVELKKWADFAAMNYKHRYELIEAVKCAILKEETKAIELFDRAIEGAISNGFVHIEALANELAAEFYLSKQREKVAKVYFTDACRAYERWGATEKVNALKKTYPHLILSPPLDSKIPDSLSNENSTSAVLDLQAIIKAFQAISSEVDFSKLLPKLMEILLENAAATKGLLFLIQNDKPILAVQGDLVDNQKIISLPFTPIEEISDLPFTTINYVYQARESLVLNQINRQQIFSNDPYVKKYQPGSILVLPVIYQGQLTGILYLENKLSKEAFTKERLEVLSLLAAQASIALENANYYKQLSYQLQQKNQELEINNIALQKSEAREREKSEQLESALLSLQRTQAQLIQSEKMSSLGQMVAGIAHEINNPANFVYGNLTYLKGYMQELLELVELYAETYPDRSPEIDQLLEEIDFNFLASDLPKLLKSMEGGIDRIREIVLALRNFSRLDEAEFKAVDIHTGIDSTLMLLQHRLKSQPSRMAIEVKKEYGQLSKLPCYPGELNQVFMNILVNAIDAIEEKLNSQKYEFTPCITISTSEIEDIVKIQIIDNGIGMPETVKKRAFDPFFTTKPVGKGIGLSLSASYFIVSQKHAGQLQCYSNPGEGTEFAIEIPIRQTRQLSQIGAKT